MGEETDLDSYNVESENFLLTFFAPSPFPSPRWGEGGGEGKFQISLARIYLRFGICDLEFDKAEGMPTPLFAR
jgi:hypothetical protein